MKNKKVHMVTFLLVIIGGINLGLTALGFDVLGMIVGQGTTAAKVLYILIGLSAVYEVMAHKGMCSHCAPAGDSDTSDAPNTSDSRDPVM